MKPVDEQLCGIVLCRNSFTHIVESQPRRRMVIMRRRKQMCLVYISFQGILYTIQKKRGLGTTGPESTDNSFCIFIPFRASYHISFRFLFFYVYKICIKYVFVYQNIQCVLFMNGSLIGMYYLNV